MNLVFIYGPPAAGKLTVAKALAEKTGYEIFHNHVTYDLYHQVMREKSEEFWEKVGDLRLELIELAAKNDVNLIFTVCYEPEDRHKYVDRILASVEKYSGKVYFVHLAPKKEVLFQRVLEDSRKEYKKLKDPEGLKESLVKHDFYQTIDEPNSIKVDNTDVPADQVAEKIITEFRL
jgi:adenylate kinase family enzyme